MPDLGLEQLGLGVGCVLDYRSLGLSGPSGVSVYGPCICNGLKVRPNNGVGPNVANWAIYGSIVGLGSLLNVGPFYSMFWALVENHYGVRVK